MRLAGTEGSTLVVRPNLIVPSLSPVAEPSRPGLSLKFAVGLWLPSGWRRAHPDRAHYEILLYYTRSVSTLVVFPNLILPAQ